MKLSSRALVAGSALLLVTLLLSAHTAEAGLKKGTKAKGAKALSFSSLVTEATSGIKKGPGPAAPKKDRSDADAKPPKPVKLPQPSNDDTAVSGQSPNPAANGRKLLALGDSCTVYVKNVCRSKKSFQAAFGYYTFNGVNAGIEGWEAQGWYNIRYGRTLKFNGFQTLYVLTLNGLKPTRTVGKAATFCVSRRPFWILQGDDDYFYTYDDDLNIYDQFYTCSGAGGYYRSGFWAPARCGTTILYQNC